MADAGPHDREQPEPIKIVNRSERVYLYGYLRMIPFLMVFGSLFLMTCTNVFTVYSKFAGIGFLVLMVVAVIVDRSHWLNPVDVIWLGRQLTIKRLVSKRTISPSQIRRIDVIPHDTQDYDEQREQTIKMVIRIRHKPRASLLIPFAALGAVCAWAEQHQRPLVDWRDTSHTDPDTE